MRADAPANRRAVWMGPIGAWLVRLLGRTWRVRVTHDEGLRRARAAGRPIVFVLWHGHMLPLLYHHRDQGVAVLISEHGDGEIIARVASRLGYRSVRGSTSRGAARALISLTKAIEAGADLAITPDGPRGPARSFAPGAVIVAQRSSSPIIPVGVSTRSAWRLRSWDGFLVPKPFAKIRIAYGDMVTVAGASSRDAADQAPRVRELLLAAEQRADASDA